MSQLIGLVGTPLTYALCLFETMSLYHLSWTCPISRAAHFGLWPALKKRRVGPTRSNMVADWANMAQKERVVLGRGCQLACHAAGQPIDHVNSHFSYKIVNNTPLNNYITTSLRGKKIYHLCFFFLLNVKCL